MAKLAIYTLLFIVAFTPSILGFLRSSYGDACNKTHRCDSKSWLGCFEGVCDCMKQEEMEFIADEDKCVSKAGERCKFMLEEIVDGVLYEMTDCVDHAECNFDGYCVCDTKYHELYNGTCCLSKCRGEKCSYVDKCSKFENLKCVGGICQCNEENSVFSPADSQCVGLSEKACVNGKCVSGANCTSENTCECLPHHYHNSTDNMCYETKNVFEKCHESFECMKKPGLILSCFHGICNCDPHLKYDTVQKYEYNCTVQPWHCHEHIESHWTQNFSNITVSRCVSHVGDNCPEGYCVANAKCEVPLEKRCGEDTRYKHGICKCLEGDYIKGKKNTTCAKKHGKKCVFNEECVDELECIEKKCSCPMPSRQKISKGLNVCFTSVGGHCSKDSVCVVNSFCDVHYGVCRCKKGFVSNALGLCEIENGRNCSESIVCDTIAGLICINNKCSCPDKMYKYSSSFRRCVGLIGAKCNPDGGPGECTENAKCFKDHPKLSGQCRCLPGFIRTHDYTCHVKPIVAPDHKSLVESIPSVTLTTERPIAVTEMNTSTDTEINAV